MLSAQSTVSAILKSPEAVAILDEYLPGASTDPKLGMAKMLTLEKISKLTPDLSPEILAKVDERLRALGE
jgi:hypothetical protein